LAGKAEISAARRALEALVIAAAPVLAIAPLVFPTVAPVEIAWAIAVSATPLRWEIAADLAADRAATAGAVLVPAPVAVHPAWVAVGADLVAAVCAEEAGVCAAAAGAGGKHHEH